MKPLRPGSLPVIACCLLAVVGLLSCEAPADTPEDPSGEAAGTSAAREGASSSEAYEAGAEEADIVATVQLLFDALESGDEELLRSVMDPSVVMHYAETVDGETAYGTATVDELAGRITSADEPLVERMWDPVVLVHGPLATVWAPYDFHVGEAFSHCGVDVADLLRTEDGWRIVGLSWTRLQPPACERHPDGPPAG